MNALTIKHLNKSFGERTIFKDVSFSLPEKGLFVVVGVSGSGKSTLLEIVAGLDTKYGGEVLTLCKELSHMKERDISDFRLSKIGFIRQNYDLLGLESVFDNVALPLRGSRLDSKTIKQKVKEALYNCNLIDKEKQMVSTLSGGEKQRVALARALVNNPSIVLADEPTGALDEKNAEIIYELLSKISKTRLVLLVSHDLERSKRYSDALLFLEDGSIRFEKTLSSASETYLSANLEKENKPHFPFSCWLRHGYHLLKAKKGRTIFSALIIVFSLVSLGLSIYVSRDLEGELTKAFSSLTGDDVVVVEKAGSAPSFGRVVSASEEEVMDLAKKNSQYVEGYGVSYITPFESYFPNANHLYFSSYGRAIDIPSMSVRSINDFLWLEDYKDQTFYPSLPSVLEQDQIVLALPYSAMVKVCEGLQILRDYETLGRSLMNQPLDLFLEVANDDWGYADTQYFKVVSVTEGSAPTIFHYDHKWNEYILEEKMRFPSDNEENHTKPWILNKACFLQLNDDLQGFFEKSRKEKDSRYVYERTSYTYDQTHNRKGFVSDLKRYYVYVSDADYLSPKKMEEIGSHECFCSKEIYGENSYSFYPDSLACGFSSPFFLGSSRSDVEMASDALTRVLRVDAMSEVKLPPTVVMGSVMKPRNTALTFSSDFSGLIEGRIPDNSNEICISSGLKAKLGENERLYCAGMVESSISGEYLNRDYRIGELKVVGVVENDLDVLYGTEYWCVDYWRDVFGMSSFLLGPAKAVFRLKKGYDGEEVTKILGAQYPAYRFVDPSKAVKESVNSVITYVKLALEIASVATLITAGFLLLVVALLTGLENKHEGKLLHTLGIKREEIFESYGASLLIVTIYSIITAVISLLTLEVAVDSVIKESFSSSAPFHPDFVPPLVTVVLGLIGLVVALLFIRVWVKKRNFLREEEKT